MCARTTDRRALPALLLLLALGALAGPACEDPRKDLQEGSPGPAAGASSGEGPTAPEAAPAEPAPVRAADLPDSPVLTWYDARGRPHLASSIEEVPPFARERVVLSQLGGGAKVALADEVTVADFSGDEPTYSRVDLRELGGDRPLDGAALLKHQQVLVYSAVWCGFCKKVKAFLKENSVAYTERDIDEDPSAAAELAAKLKAAGQSSRGIPVTDIHGELIVGFKPQAIQARLAQVGIALVPAAAEAKAPPEAE
ncbi:MAG: glutaredoxin family protein [Deltaproteobacteria bacterium]|nr:glutaredoxin family protein [Deltaproteobacteria bacterium]